MFKYLYHSLFKPQHLTDYARNKTNGKIVGYVLLLFLIMILPNTLINIFGFSFSDAEQNVIIEQLKTNQIDYKIENNKLVYTKDSTPVTQGFTLKSNDFYISNFYDLINNPQAFITQTTTTKYIPIHVIFSLDNDIDAYFNNLDTDEYLPNAKCYLVVLTSENIELYTTTLRENQSGEVKLSKRIDEKKLIKTIFYDVGNIDFEYEYNISFKEGIRKLGDNIYSQIKTGYIAFTTLEIIIVTLINTLISLFLTAGLIFLFFRVFQVPFAKILKIVILCAAPYALGYALSICYGQNIIMIIFEFFTIFRIYRVLKTYAFVDKLMQ